MSGENGCSFAICYARKEIGVRTKRNTTKKISEQFLCVWNISGKKLLKKWLAPRFPLKFFSARIFAFLGCWCIIFIAIFIFCSQKHKKFNWKRLQFQSNRIKTTSMRIATNLAQQEIEIDFMISSHCFWRFIWLLIVTDIHFIISNIYLAAKCIRDKSPY